MPIETFTDGDVSDIAICKKVGECLQKHFPDYPWQVGIHEQSTGVLVIDLPPDFKPPSLRQWGYLFHLSDVDNEKKIRDAGGEWLERLRLVRSRASEWAAEMARANGLDLRGSVLKSNH